MKNTPSLREPRLWRCSAQGHDDLIVLFNQFLPEGHDMRVVLENAKHRPQFSQGMDVLVLALSFAGVLDYLPGVVTARALNGTFTVMRHDGRLEQSVTPNRLKLEHLDLGATPAQMEPDENSQNVRVLARKRISSRSCLTPKLCSHAGLGARCGWSRIRRCRFGQLRERWHDGGAWFRASFREQLAAP